MQIVLSTGSWFVAFVPNTGDCFAAFVPKFLIPCIMYHAELSINEEEAYRRLISGITRF